MPLDDLIRAEAQRIAIPFDAATEAAAIRARVWRRRRSRRRRAVVPIGTAAAVAIGIGVLVTGPSGDPSERVTTATTATLAPTTTTAPDSLAAAGPCRSLLPETVDPLDPDAASSSTTPTPPQTGGGLVADVDAWEPEANTPCGEALATAVRSRIGQGWRPWEDNPFGNAAIGESAPPDSYGTASVSLIADDGVILQVTAGYGPPGEAARIQGFGRPLEDLPDGWVGTTNFVAGEDRVSAHVTVVRPGRLPVMVVVEVGKPGMGPPKPEGSVLPVTFDEARALAIDLAVEGPIQSP